MTFPTSSGDPPADHMPARQAGADHPADHMPRRQALVTLGGLGAAALWLCACGRGAAVKAATRTGLGASSSQRNRASAAASCVLTPEVTEGPYYIPNGISDPNIAD